MNAIVCADENWGIGKNNNLLFSIPDDMKHFVYKTSGNIIVIGRKTLESFRDKKPLKNRLNIVLTRDKTLNKNYTEYDNIVFISNKSELNNILDNIDKLFPKYKNAECYICGGDSIYKLFLEDCSNIYVTKMYESFDADTFFPNLDDNSDFSIVDKSEVFEYENIKYQFITYNNDKK